MSGRQRFECASCGLTVEGRMNSRGEIIPYDRAGWDGSDTQSVTCVSCAKEYGEAEDDDE